MTLEYSYDAFFSYKRDPESDDWHEKVKEKLEHWLKNEVSDFRGIFFDRADIGTGELWNSRLKDALLQSKCIVCIWSPAYFRSRHCVSEWKTFQKREEAFKPKQPLIRPARYHDGVHFPQEARAQQVVDFGPYASTIGRFWDTERACEFEEKHIKKLAVDVAASIEACPECHEQFPLYEATDGDLIAAPSIARLGGARS